MVQKAGHARPVSISFLLGSYFWHSGDDHLRRPNPLIVKSNHTKWAPPTCQNMTLQGPINPGWTSPLCHARMMVFSILVSDHFFLFVRLDKNRFLLIITTICVWPKLESKNYKENFLEMSHACQK